MNFKNLFLTTCTLLFTFSLNAQTIMNADFSEAGSGLLIASYTGKSYTEFWAGEMVMDAPNEGLDQNIYSLYGSYAFTDGIEAVVNLPYISNTSKDDSISFNGLQDISLFVKAKLYGGDKLTAGVAVGTNIAADYNAANLYSLGNGSSSVEGLALLSYKLPAGLSLEAQAGYSIKTQEITPNAVIGQIRLGYSSDVLYAGVTYGIQRSSDEGIDIGSDEFMGPPTFPATQVNYDQLMFSVYLPVGERLAATGYYGTILDGRNIGDATFYGIGLGFRL